MLAVTGPLGASRAGLALLENEALAARELDPQHVQRAQAAFATPIPRVREGRWLAASLNVHALMDLSDGLVTDVPRLAAASGLAAVIETVPIDAAAAALAAAAGDLPQEWALRGGEDFELLLAVEPRAFAHLAHRYQQRFGADLLRIGRLEAGSGVRLLVSDGSAPLPAPDFTHF